MNRVFLLSPAHCRGARARMLLSPRASFELAGRVRDGAGAPLGEVFAFLSGLYFRGKLAYARAFASPPAGVGGVYVITPCRGLRPADESVDARSLREFARVDIHRDEPRYRKPLERDARALASLTGPVDEVVLLGSVASDKYVDLLLDALGARLRFPIAFVGRGDMSRGGLLLRSARAGVELDYAPVQGAVLRGARPARLSPLR